MENRFLCRGKRIGNGEWVEGFLVPFAGDDKNRFWQIKKVDDIKKPSISQTVRVNPSTICQCTGLKDKNGNLIWENDIVAYWDSYSTENGLEEADCIGKVVWDDETISFQVTNRLSAESYEVLDDECSVIGNTFDNPELLEV